MASKGEINDPNDQEEEVEPVEDSSEVEEEEILEDDELAPLRDDEELWPGGPTGEQIQAWKREHGDESIYVTSLTPTKHVVWRTIYRSEYRNVVKTIEQAVAQGKMSQAEASLANEELITEICLLYPKYTRADLSKEIGGLASIIHQEVLEASGFVALEVRML
ncbi:MAG TPA: hypothetical protein VJ742_12215 [Nitrososphaera sp.]|nr:hypothetical protein [Nitrososphaera sp.]